MTTLSRRQRAPYRSERHHALESEFPSTQFASTQFQDEPWTMPTKRTPSEHVAGPAAPWDRVAEEWDSVETEARAPWFARSPRASAAIGVALVLAVGVVAWLLGAGR